MRACFLGLCALSLSIPASYYARELASCAHRGTVIASIAYLKLLSICFIVFGIITLYVFTITLSEKYAEYYYTSKLSSLLPV